MEIIIVIYDVYEMHNMVKKEIKSIRISGDNHTRLIKLQGRIQNEEEVVISMDDVIDILVTSYELGPKKSKK